MSLAKDVNNLLDRLQYELNKGEINKPEITEIKSSLNKVTNNGQNCRDLFTNIYYVNNFLMDKELNKTGATTEEEIAHNLMEGLAHGKN